jgi:hypothetical protein
MTSSHFRDWRGLAIGVLTGLAIGVSGTVIYHTRPVSAVEVVEPCHTVRWPSSPLPSAGGRVWVEATASKQPCKWSAPVLEATWLIVTPPALSATPPRTSLNGIPPFALPDYSPSARSLAIEFAANPTAKTRSVAFQFGGVPVIIEQQASADSCLSPAGPGYVHHGWRYRITAKAYPKSASLLESAQAEVGPLASGVSWQDLRALLEGRPDRGLEFARALGLARHSWEENFQAAYCYTYWLSQSEEPEFIAFHLGRKPDSFESYSDINDNQYDLGRWPLRSQVIYRERVP